MRPFLPTAALLAVIVILVAVTPSATISDVSNATSSNPTSTSTSTTTTMILPHVCDDIAPPCAPGASACIKLEGDHTSYTCRCVKPYAGADSDTGADCGKMSIGTRSGEGGLAGSLYVQVVKGGDLELTEATGGRTVGVFKLHDGLTEVQASRCSRSAPAPAMVCHAHCMPIIHQHACVLLLCDQCHPCE